MSGKNRKYLIYDGSFWAIFDGLTSPFIIPYALLFGASNTIVGIIGALPYLGSVIGQIPGAEVVERYKDRIKIEVVLSIIGRSLWIPILLLPLLFGDKLVIPLIILLAIYWLIISIKSPALQSAMSDIVPERIRGRYFGKRNMFIGLFSMLATLGGGLLLDRFKGNEWYGFASMFAIALVFVAIAIYFSNKIKVRKYQDHDHKLKDFFDVRGEFKKFIIFISYFNFAYMLASPLFTVYMLVNLKMDYTTFALFNAVSVVTWIIFQGKWGKISDKYGDKAVLLACTFGTALVPLAFLLATPSTLWVLIPAQILSGMMWAGQELSVFNFLLDVTSKKKKAVQLADYNALASIPLIIAPILGGLISDNITFVLSGIPLVFVMSAILRLSAVPLIAKLKEPRASQEYPAALVLREATNIHPARGLIHEVKVLNYCVSCAVKFKKPKLRLFSV